MTPDSPTAAAETAPPPAPPGASAAGDSAFKPLPSAARLRVPYTTRAAVESVQARPVGTAVRRGQMLTESLPQLGHAPIAPVDGTVVGVESVQLLDGRSAMAVVLETRTSTAAPAESPPVHGAAPKPVPTAAASPRPQPAADLFGEIQPAEKGTWIEDMRHAGIWADRWSSPNLMEQLHQSLRRPVDTVVCSVLDGDRAVPLQGVVADTFGVELAAGMALLAKLAGADRAWVVADVLSPAAFQWKLRRQIEGTGARLVPMPNDYPQADPTLLLHALLDRRLPPDHLPTDAGALLVDAAAAVAVGRFARAREPMASVPLAVYDAASDSASFLTVPVGTSLHDLLDYLDVRDESVTLRGGPPPRDLRLRRGAVTGGAELTVYVTAPERYVNPDPCIRCGWCVEGCPVRVHPAGLLEASQADDAELAETYGLAACIECGICNYVCPSRLPLLEGIRTLRRRGPAR